MSIKTILILAQKGGVGKTTLANELAYSFERTGTPYSFISLDPQGEGQHHTNEIDDAVIQIVDTAGVLQDDIADMVKSSDLVIVPSGATGLDVQPLMRVGEIVNENLKPGAKLLYVINQVTRWTTSSKFVEWFNERKNGFAVELPSSEYYRKAVSMDTSVMKCAPKGSNVAVATMRFINEVRGLIGLDLEPVV